MRILALFIEFGLPVILLGGVSFYLVKSTILAPKKISNWISEVELIKKNPNLSVSDCLMFFKEKMSEVETQLDNQDVIYIFEIYKDIEDVVNSYQERNKQINQEYSTLMKKILLEMVPKTIEQYLSLPPDFATEHKNNEGKTAKDIFSESIKIIHESVNELKIDLLEDNLKDLKANYSYLNSKLN